VRCGNPALKGEEMREIIGNKNTVMSNIICKLMKIVYCCRFSIKECKDI